MKAVRIFLIFLIATLSYSTKSIPAVNLRETPIVKAVRQASPAVVNISTERVVRVRQNPFFRFRFDPFSSMENFLDDFFSGKDREQSIPNSLGSGVIVDDENHVLTNHHVIVSASKIKITLADKREYEAKLLGSDPNSDLAVLKIQTSEKLPKISMGTSSDLMIGETIIAIGNPFGLAHTVTTGVISAVDRTVKAGDELIFENFIQTDASINPGNSGGALLNIEGKLIGINTAIYEKAQGIGFATPVDKARKILKSLLTYGEVPPIWLGAKVTDLATSLGKFFSERPTQKGVVVSMIETKGPAEASGLKAGDKVLKIGKINVDDTGNFASALSRYTINETIPLTISRAGQTYKIRIKARPFPARYAQKLSEERLGLEVADNTKLNRLRFQAPSNKGVIVSKVLPKGPTKRIGIQKGDIIHQLDNEEIAKLSDFKKAALRLYYKDVTNLVVQRGGYLYKLTIKLD